VKAPKDGDLKTLKKILAVNALLRGYFRNEPYLPSGSTVHRSHRILLLDLSTVSHTQATKNAKRGLFFKYEYVNV
jgi:hypothetical protein